jgi:hypothetical protein
MSDFDDLAKASGINTEDESLKLTNTGSSQYEFAAGEYQVFVGHFRVTYKDKENNKCEPDAPGASAAFGMQDFFVIKSPEKMMVDKEFNLAEGEDVRGFVYKQYITLESDKQWQNKNVYQSFFVENVPQFDVVENKDKADFVVRLGIVKAYFGAPATMVLAKSKKNNIFMSSLELGGHTIDKDKIEKRKKVMSKLYSQVDELWEKVKAERAAAKGGHQTR